MGIFINGSQVGVSASTAWDDITGKPSVFPPDDHAASKITTGTMATARLGSGTANKDRLLRGDQKYGVEQFPGIAGGRLAGSTLLAASNDMQIGMTTNNVFVDGQLRASMVALPFDATITGVTFVLGVQGNFTGDNFNGACLFTSDGTNLTCVAVSANNEAPLESAAHARVNVAFSSTYAATAGVYWVGLIYNQSAVVTAPQQRCQANVGNSGHQSIFLPTNQRYVFTVNKTSMAVNDSFAWTTTSSTSAVPWVALY